MPRPFLVLDIGAASWYQADFMDWKHELRMRMSCRQQKVNEAQRAPSLPRPRSLALRSDVTMLSEKPKNEI